MIKWSMLAPFEGGANSWGAQGRDAQAPEAELLQGRHAVAISQRRKERGAAKDDQDTTR